MAFETLYTAPGNRFVGPLANPEPLIWLPIPGAANFWFPVIRKGAQSLPTVEPDL